MGMNRYFRIAINEPEGLPDQEIDDLIDLLDDMFKVGFDGNGTHDPQSWYEVDEDMVSFSALLPDYLFALECEGQNDDDCWIGYYKAGETYTCYKEVYFPDLDKRKLKPLETECKM